MINIMPIFINFLAVDSRSLDNAAIEKFCLERKNNGPGRTISNSGGWQSDNLDPETPELAGPFGEVRKRLDEVHRAFEFNPSLRQVITEPRININQKGHFNNPRGHPGSLFSA